MTTCLRQIKLYPHSLFFFEPKLAHFACEFALRAGHWEYGDYGITEITEITEITVTVHEFPVS